MKLTRPSRAASTMVLGVFSLVATTIFAQQLTKPSEEAAHTARVICTMVNKYHINHGEVDDTIAPKLFDRFVNLLDPQKLYFVASDIEEFSANRMKLDDQVKSGDVSFAYEVFNRYSDRVSERVEHAHSLVDLPHDFTADEEMTTDSEDLVWAKTQDDISERWRKRVKYEVLTFKLDGKDLKETRDRLHKRYRTIKRSIDDTESSEVLEMYLSSLTHCFDPHSSYMSPETLEEFRIAMQLSLDGIGAALRSEDGYTFVASVVKGGAADKDGRLEVGDKIIGVGQETGDIEDIVEMKLSKVVRRIRGKRGSKVRLQCVKEGSGETVTYELIRQKIELKESAVKGEIINTKDRTGRDARIGVINIPSFYRDFKGAEQGLDNFKSTARDLQKVLLDFKDRGGVDAIIVDLRYNGGGALSEAIEVTGLFIDEGPVVQVKETGSRVKTLVDEISGAFNEPLVVVCNRMSASASEIFAGAIKDYRRGIVVGDETTHGKGTVQNVMPVGLNMFSFFNNRKDRGALKLTINQFYRVNGDSTQNLGVKSDVVLPSLLDHMNVGESSLDNALAFDRIAASDFEKLAYVNGDVIDKLTRSSKRRVGADEEFQKIQKDIKEYLDRKNRKTVTLNEEKLRKEREDDKKKEEKEEDEEEDEGPVLPETAYNDELLNIAIDYAELLGTRKTAKR